MYRLLVVLLTLSVATWAFAADLGPKNTDPVPFKGSSHVGANPAYDSREGGEDIATAVPILAMPFSDSGATCDNIDNYDEACPYTGSTAPDVVYSYTPAGDEILFIDLCYSLYDTKVFVYQDDEFTLVGCNDDFYFGPPCWTYSSYLEQIVAPGHTYYIVVDGYGGDCGTYQLDITAEPYIPPEPLECDPEYTVPEGEPPLVVDYDDNYNGGCNSAPEIFQDIHWIDDATGCAHLSGVSGWYPFTGISYRDTDWFNIVAASDEIVVRFECNNTYTQSWVALTNAFPNCSSFTIDGGQSDIIANTTYQWTLPTIPGANYWIIVLPSTWIQGPLEWEYCLEVCGIIYDVVPVEEASWGSVKSMYK